MCVLWMFETERERERDSAGGGGGKRRRALRKKGRVSMTSTSSIWLTEAARPTMLCRLKGWGAAVVWPAALLSSAPLTKKRRRRISGGGDDVCMHPATKAALSLTGALLPLDYTPSVLFPRKPPAANPPTWIRRTGRKTEHFRPR